MNLNDLGFTSFHADMLDVDSNTFKIARVISVNKESYKIHNGEKELFAKVTGNLLYSSDSPEDFPTVGDFVLFQSFEDDSLAIIHKTLERKTLLKRKTPGKKIEFQLIAANLDFAIIIQSLDNDFNPKRLERYLAMVNEFGIEPIILFSKSDLINEHERNKIITNIKSSLSDLKVISFSNFDDSNIDLINSIFMPNKTYCLIGSSGVGKTTLLNNLIGRNEFKTKEVRENDSKGKHTTTNRQLVQLENGAMIIDTPGMRELGNISINDGIEKTFDEILDLSCKCKFADCSHTVEKGCAILDALENGDLDRGRYDNYIKLRKESDYYKRSYLEKRKKDKEFGKMIKSVMKHKKKK
jgi:ribosome biogenesis GTPase / thiamine phosphate phosphatase